MSTAIAANLPSSSVAASKIDFTNMPKHKFMYNTTGAFVAPFSGFVRVTVNTDGHNSAGTTAQVTVNNTVGSLTKLGSQDYQTVDSGSSAGRSHTAKAVFSGVTSGTSYTFAAQASVGGINWATFTSFEAEFIGTDQVAP